jgi:hypothetical protein
MDSLLYFGTTDLNQNDIIQKSVSYLNHFKWYPDD